MARFRSFFAIGTLKDAFGFRQIPEFSQIFALDATGSSLTDKPSPPSLFVLAGFSVMAKMASWEAGMTGRKRGNPDDYIGIAGGGVGMVGND